MKKKCLTKQCICFGNKVTQLFLRAFEQYRLTSIRATTEFLEGQPQVKIGFRKLFEQAIQESCVDQDKKGCFVVNTATELIPGDEKIQEIIQGNNKKLETVFYEYLLKGEVDGQFKKGKDLKATAALLFTFLNGLRVVTKASSNEAELYNSVNLVLSVLD